tara:strand:+ start:457 stop:699 length:243 start_codon:yes stop_codon:yes gene_type:complete
MKKQELLNSLLEQAETIQKEMTELQNQFNTRKEQLLKISGAVEALNSLTEDVEEQPVGVGDHQTEPDHSAAAAALSAIGA